MKTMKKFAALMMLLCALMICTIPALAANNKHTGVERFRVGNKLSLCHFENIAFDLFSLSIQFIQFLRFYLGYLSGLSHKKFCRRFRTVITSCGIYTGA